MQITRPGITLALAATLSACGGSVGDATHRGGGGTTPVTVAALGLYVGYYQEDPTNDTANSVPGAFVLNLPSTTSGAALNGTMDYSFATCQTDDSVPVTGTRTDLGVSGAFTGTVDGTTQAGSYSATLDTTALNFTGSYINNGGKQAIVFGGCANYTIAGLGTVELFPLSTNYPSTNFAVSYDVPSRTVSWSPISGTTRALVYVVDSALATNSSDDPVPYQVVLGTTLSTVLPASVPLTSGKTYYVVVALSNTNPVNNVNTVARVAFGSKSFQAP